MRMPQMLAQLHAASVVLTAVKSTLVAGFAALHRAYSVLHKGETKCVDNKEDFVGEKPKLCEL